MKIVSVNKLCLCLCISLLFVTALYAEGSVICVRKTVKLKKQKIKFQNLFVSESTECPNGFVAIFRERSSEEVVADVATSDGRGSQIDADFLDGISSEDFAQQSDLRSVAGVVQSNKEAAETLSNRMASLRGRIEAFAIVRVVTVAHEGGDFRTIEAALDSLDGPALENPFVISVAPGRFSIESSIIVPAGVTLQGSGQQRTILEGAFGAATVLGGGLVRLQDGAVLSDLTVINNPAQDISVVVTVENTQQAKLPEPTSFKTIIENCQIIAEGSGASDSYGIVLNAASLKVSASSLDIRSSANSSYGVVFIGGINSRLLMAASNILAQGVTTGVGIDVLSLSARAKIDHSDIFGSSNALRDSLGLLAEIYSSKLRSDEIAILAAGPASTHKVFYSAFQAPDHVSTLPPAQVTCAFASDIDSGAGFASTCE
ncbi:MAG: hypothetical protein KDD62_05550 [Bdellovibrionales bacterium]|nr:hypothetical protein [Bdellovibrionales bacterium]